MSADKPHEKLRRLLEGGPIDKRMLARLDLFNELRAAIEGKDKDAQLAVVRKLQNNGNDILAEKSRASAAITTAFEDATATPDPDERTSKLLTAFELAAKTKFWAYDALGDIDTGNAIALQLGKIVRAFKAVPPGRLSALATFLDNPDVGVRCMAAKALQNIMPERAIPILQKIQKEELPSSVGFAAMWALRIPKGEANEGKA